MARFQISRILDFGPIRLGLRRSRCVLIFLKKKKKVKWFRLEVQYIYVCMVTHIARVGINRVRLPFLLVVSFFFFFFKSHLWPMDLIITILPVVTKDLPISPRFTPYNFSSRCKFSTLTTRQPMVEFYLLTFPRFPLRQKKHKSYFGKNRTNDFRTGRLPTRPLGRCGQLNREK